MKTRALSKTDYTRWRSLWDQYLIFYQHELSEEQTQLTFERLTDPAYAIQGLVLEADGIIVGFSHSSFTHTTWAKEQDLCLEDLFVDPIARGKGFGRALIEATANLGKQHGAHKLYWQTHRDNATAQHLYQTLAVRSEFLIFEKII